MARAEKCWKWSVIYAAPLPIVALVALTFALPVSAIDDDEIENSVGMRFVLIPRGAFEMGSPVRESGRGDDEWRHEVQISKPFYLSAFETTQGQYQQIMGKSPSFFAASGPGKSKVRPKEAPLHPVENVSWDDAALFCEKLSASEDEKRRKRRFRLPTEAEWEWACRAGTTMAFYYGDHVGSNEANFNGFSPLGKGRPGPFLRMTWSGGGYKANAFGVFDMHGNVAEWCADWYDADYYKKSPRVDPPGPSSGSERVVRGGGWTNTARACRSAARHHFAPDFAGYNIGFRVVMVQEQ